MDLEQIILREIRKFPGVTRVMLYAQVNTYVPRSRGTYKEISATIQDLIEEGQIMIKTKEVLRDEFENVLYFKDPDNN